MAQGYRLASLGSSDSGQALPFRARSESHGSRLGCSNPGSALSAHGSRPAAHGSGRGSGHGSMLPISFPLLLGLGSSTTFLSPCPIPRLTPRAFLPRLGCVGPRPAAWGEAPCYHFPSLCPSDSGQALPHGPGLAVRGEATAMALCYLLPPKANSLCFALLPEGKTQVRVKLCHLSVFKSCNFFG